MEKEFLQGLGLEEETVNKILTRHGADLTAVQKELSEARTNLETLQTRYDTDTADLAGLRQQLAGRDYSDAVLKAVSAAGLKFSSKAAERDFVSRLREEKFELKDGRLSIPDGYIKAQKEADPDAFASDKPAPHFVAPAGSGGETKPVKTAAELAAETIGRARAESNKAAESVISMYTGGKS